MAAWRRRTLEFGSGCMCDLIWRCMWEAPSVMFADWSFDDTCQLEGFLFFTEIFTIFMVYLTACQWIVPWHHLNGLVHISSVMMHFLSTPIPQKIF
ncbi:hypothetical protein OUZ56_002670 [Daphnia magna]|uniref:Uncharacterized protein n=1 Tax=Daphnia magna TaxID=35525 RepID=A0ABR0A6G1_9CRUS|nr:hypothetical protein OUZ56_002670 [Daphnia magna]